MDAIPPQRSNSVLSIVTSDSTSTPRRNVPVGVTTASQHPLSEEVAVVSEAELDNVRRISAKADDLQEVKEALNKVLSVADTLSATLAALRSQQAKQETTIQDLRENQQDLETTLTLAKSNLALERANNEMLEDALKRSGGASAGKDVGWKRYSEREASTLFQRSVTPNPGKPAAMARPGTARSASELEPPGEVRRRSLSTGTPTIDSNSATPITSSDMSTSPTHAKMPIPPTPPERQQESSRFFKFRFGTSGSGAAKSPSAASPSRLPMSAGPSGGGALPPANTSSAVHLTTASLPAHLTSTSMPSLVPGQALTMTTSSTGEPASPTAPPTISQEELLVLRAELSNVKIELQSLRSTHAKLKKTHVTLEASHQTLVDEKKALEEELESLSQALFEEANKMVADERKKCAAYEEELQQCRAQVDALKGALKVVESENSSLRVRKDSLGMDLLHIELAGAASTTSVSQPPRNGIDEGYRDEEHGGSHTPRPSVSSSLHGVKSRPTSPAAARTSTSNDSTRQSIAPERSPLPATTVGSDE
ncbi:hypothetical protein FRB95_000666 [Tulasnella sp. JGI-2019a]|nr:hypothetical protein FRB93_003055 [Tulasnella sp. JGI-2019a]KAG9033004.1 hypothetical protein FRB95_000666 [Tulasnella sp. JGI-2019a]